MIGRQMMNLDARQLRLAHAEAGTPLDESEALGLLPHYASFAEPWLSSLGAKCVESVDFADYEGATILHDMNTELPSSLENRFSAVIDGGSLEHIFNFPVAIRNCMKMVQPGGHFLSISPANNWMGHGFYQFSPELFSSIFSPPSGFVLKDMLLAEWMKPGHWYRVRRPQDAKRRVTLRNGHPVYLYVIAQRTETGTPPLFFPSQSDYVAVWDESTRASNHLDAANQSPRSFCSRIVRSLRSRIQHAQRSLRIRLARGYDPDVIDRIRLFDRAHSSNCLDPRNEP